MMQISQQGAPRDAAYDAYHPDVTYNVLQDEYFVTWLGNDTVSAWAVYGQRMQAVTGSLTGTNQRYLENGAGNAAVQQGRSTSVAFSPGSQNYLILSEAEHGNPTEKGSTNSVYAQLVDGQTGSETGPNDWIVSDMRFITDHYGSRETAVAYNPLQQEIFVVWQANSNEDGLHQFKIEIYGQRIDANTGEAIGNRIRISQPIEPTNNLLSSSEPAVAYSEAANVYFVAWRGTYFIDDVRQNEIYGARISAFTGVVLDANTRISFMGPNDDADYGAFDRPDIVYNSKTQALLVVWEGKDDHPGLANNEKEIYGQQVNSLTGTLLGDNIRLSFAGPDGSDAYRVSAPKAVYNEIDNHFLVVWTGEDNVPGHDTVGDEVYGQVLQGDTLAHVGDMFRISYTGPEEDSDYEAKNTAVTYNNIAQEYLVIWQAPVAVEDDWEIFGQRIAAQTSQPIGNNFRLSHTGSDGDPAFRATRPSLAFDPAKNSYLAVWQAYEFYDNGNYDGGIYGQYVQSNGATLGLAFRISQPPIPNASIFFDVHMPTIVSTNLGNRFIAFWEMNTVHEALSYWDTEIFGQFLGEATGQYDLYLPMIVR
ncbi:hypothetical protein [Candidatus Leptofilum sp.]|uniref:hypothetical protein n=1 Tax=Candidatus Leptofilum sp. TaxID=3241576 RepID=UPI003B5C62DD